MFKILCLKQATKKTKTQTPTKLVVKGKQTYSETCHVKQWLHVTIFLPTWGGNCLTNFISKNLHKLCNNKTPNKLKSPFITPSPKSKWFESGQWLATLLKSRISSSPPSVCYAWNYALKIKTKLLIEWTLKYPYHHLSVMKVGGSIFRLLDRASKYFWFHGAKKGTAQTWWMV